MKFIIKYLLICFTTVSVAQNIVPNNSIEVGITIPNVFTPNADGINDAFRLKSFGVTEVHADIYNRWGKKVYDWNTPEGFWDGRTPAGIEVPDGVYYYFIKYKDINGVEEIKSGVLQLLR